MQKKFDIQMNTELYSFVPKTGVEPARLSTHAPETCASTNSASWASIERKTRLELATPTLARLCSTNWAFSAYLSICLATNFSTYILYGWLFLWIAVQRYGFFLNAASVFGKKSEKSMKIVVFLLWLPIGLLKEVLARRVIAPFLTIERRLF